MDPNRFKASGSVNDHLVKQGESGEAQEMDKKSNGDNTELRVGTVRLKVSYFNHLMDQNTNKQGKRMNKSDSFNHLQRPNSAVNSVRNTAAVCDDDGNDELNIGCVRLKASQSDHALNQDTGEAIMDQTDSFSNLHRPKSVVNKTRNAVIVLDNDDHDHQRLNMESPWASCSGHVVSRETSAETMIKHSQSSSGLKDNCNYMDNQEKLSSGERIVEEKEKDEEEMFDVKEEENFDVEELDESAHEREEGIHEQMNKCEDRNCTLGLDSLDLDCVDEQQDGSILEELDQLAPDFAHESNKELKLDRYETTGETQCIAVCDHCAAEQSKDTLKYKLDPAKGGTMNNKSKKSLEYMEDKSDTPFDNPPQTLQVPNQMPEIKFVDLKQASAATNTEGPRLGYTTIKGSADRSDEKHVIKSCVDESSDEKDVKQDKETLKALASPTVKSSIDESSDEKSAIQEEETLRALESPNMKYSENNPREKSVTKREATLDYPTRKSRSTNSTKRKSDIQLVEASRPLDPHALYLGQLSDGLTDVGNYSYLILVASVTFSLFEDAEYDR